jgi:group I intron endonuclease
MKNKISGIYEIKSKSKPERSYIGSAINIYKRWQHHSEDLRKGNHHSKKLQRHYNKYGEFDLEYVILMECNNLDLIKNEQIFINQKKPYFNICKVAGNSLGCHWTLSEETKQKMSKSKIGIPHGPMSEEHKKKLSIIRKGRKCPWMSRTKTKEHINKIAESLRNKKHTKEHNLKISISMLGKKRGSYIKKLKTNNKNPIDNF